MTALATACKPFTPLPSLCFLLINIAGFSSV